MTTAPHGMRLAMPALLAIAAMTVSCGGASPSTLASPSADGSVASAEASASAMPDDHAPEELQGSWEATISTGEHVLLELRAAGYTVNREGAIGTGSISVDGDTITFASARCELGSGSYQWVVDGETLTLTPLEPRDPCANRIILFEDAAYTRAE